MLGRKEQAADVTLTTPTDFATAQLANGELALSFSVEEDEMLVDLELSLTYSHTTNADPSDFTIFVDGTDIAPGANGLVRHTPAAADDENTLYVSRTVRLARGLHIAELRAKTGSNNIVIEGATIPAALVARRSSHPATLGHGVDSKVQLIQ